MLEAFGHVGGLRSCWRPSAMSGSQVHLPVIARSQQHAFASIEQGSRQDNG
jgi:hypothetical protein